MIYTSTLGLFHLIVSCLALFAGTWVITTPKGTAIHKKIGYVYAASMVAVIITSFMMYRLLVVLEFFTLQRLSVRLHCLEE